MVSFSEVVARIGCRQLPCVTPSALAPNVTTGCSAVASLYGALCVQKLGSSRVRPGASCTSNAFSVRLTKL